MTSQQSSTDQLPDYAELSDLFSIAEGIVSVAESQGIACGLLAVDLSIDKQGWLDEVLDRERDRQNYLIQEAETSIVGIFDRVLQQLTDSNLQFELLLLDDDHELSERFVAMQEWIRGLLYGLSLLNINRYDDLPEDSQSFLHDAMQISTATDIDFEDDDSEDALIEIVEYLRVGTLLLAEEIQPSKQQSVSLH